MMSTPAISLLGTAAATTGKTDAVPSAAESSTSFADALKQFVEGAENNAGQANTAVTGMLDKSVDVHDAMIALQRAEMSLQLAVQIRNKLVQAYQDIMRMPV
jgi:flagellar hook-basal body complex protein FliE